jgi:hypothetical protein
MLNSTVRAVHFEDFGGPEFERLVFAYHVRAGWSALAWYGQSGSDQGRDIVGLEPLDGEAARPTIIQCVNRGVLTREKAEADIRKAVKAPTGVPKAFKFVCRGAVSASRRDEITKVARQLGIQTVTTWSGVDFEDHLRLIADDILKRFVNGEPFPDSGAEIAKFVDDFPGLTDDETLNLMAAVFDRPAFRTPFHAESHLPAFLQAIEDTIGALNVGIWRTREGADIRRIPSVYHLRNDGKAAAVRRVIRKLDALRRVFKDRLADGSIQHCSCGQENCPAFIFSPDAARELDKLRVDTLNIFRSVQPSFQMNLE